MNKYSKYIAEVLGTLLIVFIGAGKRKRTIHKKQSRWKRIRKL